MPEIVGFGQAGGAVLAAGLKFLAVLNSSELRDLLHKGGVVSVACEVAAAVYSHPSAFRDRGQKLFHHALMHQEVFKQKPAELMGEFKGSDESQLLELAQRVSESAHLRAAKARSKFFRPYIQLTSVHNVEESATKSHC